MAKTFTVAVKSVPDNDANRHTTIKDWLDGLSIGDSATVHSITMVHLRGFYELTVIYE